MLPIIGRALDVLREQLIPEKLARLCSVMKGGHNPIEAADARRPGYRINRQEYDDVRPTADLYCAARMPMLETNSGRNSLDANCSGGPICIDRGRAS
jgi:hypothetical protein